MAFQTGHRRGQVWDDVQTLNKIIHNTRFNLTGKSEREFELAFMSSVNANADRINDDGIAIEIKYLSGSLDGLKQAIGQSIFYRVRYRFVKNVFVIAEKYKDTYLKGANEEEKDLEEIFQDLSTDMNIFS